MIPTNFFEETHVYSSIFMKNTPRPKASSRLRVNYNIPRLAKAIEYLRKEINDYEKLKLMHEDIALLKETIHMGIDDAKSLLELIEKVLK